MNEPFILHTNTDIRVVQNGTILSTLDIPFHNNVLDLSIFRIAETIYLYSRNTHHLTLYHITDNDGTLLTHGGIIETNLTDNHSGLFLTTYKDKSHFVTFNNESSSLEFYTISDHTWELAYDTAIELNDQKIDKDIIQHIDFQDNFIYLLTIQGYLLIISPNHQIFGTMNLQELTSNSSFLYPKLIGTHLYYIESDNTLCRFCLVNKTLDRFSKCQFFSYIRGRIIILADNQIRYLDNDAKVFEGTDSSDVYVHQFLTLSVDRDIRHGNSLYNLQTCVKTFYLDEMDDNLQHIAISLCDVAKKLYDNKSLMQNMKLNTNKRYYPFLRHPYKNLYFGKDVRDLARVKQDFFHKYTNYQELLNDMSALNLDRNSMSSVNPFAKHIQQYIMTLGIDINPFYILSGPFHFTWPMCGKGWHHNIENVPRQKCDVIYFITTDQNHYGGSFFFYRHPHSHLIHAVPDVHATMKIFQLVSNIENPLWHALGSFTAHRISWGLSRRSEMYPSEDDKINNPVIIHEMNQNSE